MLDPLYHRTQGSTLFLSIDVTSYDNKVSQLLLGYLVEGFGRNSSSVLLLVLTVGCLPETTITVELLPTSLILIIILHILSTSVTFPILFSGNEMPSPILLSLVVPQNNFYLYHEKFGWGLFSLYFWYTAKKSIHLHANISTITSDLPFIVLIFIAATLKSWNPEKGRVYHQLEDVTIAANYNCYISYMLRPSFELFKNKVVSSLHFSI